MGRGKRQISEEATLQSAEEAVLTKYRVTGLLTYRFERQVEKELKFVGRGRGGANRPQQVCERVRYQITAVERNQEAIAQFVSTLGWRAYATNAPPKRLSLEQAVREYRHEYHIEHGFGWLKGAPLSIAPMFVKRDDQVTGLTHHGFTLVGMSRTGSNYPRGQSESVPTIASQISLLNGPMFEAAPTNVRLPPLSTVDPVTCPGGGAIELSVVTCILASTLPIRGIFST